MKIEWDTIANDIKGRDLTSCLATNALDSFMMDTLHSGAWRIPMISNTGRTAGALCAPYGLAGFSVA